MTLIFLAVGNLCYMFYTILQKSPKYYCYKKTKNASDQF